MSTTTNTTTAAMADPVPESDALHRRREALHHGCIACGREYVGGIGLRCELQRDGSVAGVFEPQGWMTGYDGRLHGGIVAMLLDSAMTQCLFAHDHAAVTAVLHIRYRKPAPLTGRYRVEARLDEARHGHFRLSARLWRAAERIAEADAQFVLDPDETGTA